MLLIYFVYYSVCMKFNFLTCVMIDKFLKFFIRNKQYFLSVRNIQKVRLNQNTK